MNTDTLLNSWHDFTKKWARKQTGIKLARLALFAILMFSSCEWNNNGKKGVNTNDISLSFDTDQQKENTIQYADSLHNVANNSFDELEFPDALQDYLDAYDIYNDSLDHENAWKSALDIARIYLNEEEYKRAFDYYNKSLEHVSEVDYPAGKLLVYKEIILNNFDIQNKDIFIKYFDMWVNLYDNLDDNQKDERTKNKYIKFLIASVDYLITTNTSDEEVNVAFDKIKELIWEDFSLIKDEELKVRLAILTWQTQLNKWDYSKALKQFEWIKIDSIRDLSIKKQLYYLMYLTYDKIWDYEGALKYHVLRVELSKEVSDEQKQIAVIRIAMKYESEKKDEIIEKLREQLEWNQ